MNSDAHVLLREHSNEVGTTCYELLGKTYADEPHDLVAAFRRFEHAALEHLALEEELLLPGYALYAAEDARKLREEHAELRILLYGLAIEVELHVVKAASVDTLVVRLREHATHEDEGLYAWAATHLTPSELSELVRRVGASRPTLDDVRARPVSPRIAVHRAITKALGRHAVRESTDIRVDVTDGEATLTGIVDSQHERELALSAARRVDGIVHVVDHLAIEP